MDRFELFGRLLEPMDVSFIVQNKERKSLAIVEVINQAKDRPVAVCLPPCSDIDAAKGDNLDAVLSGMRAEILFKDFRDGSPRSGLPR